MTYQPSPQSPDRDPYADQGGQVPQQPLPGYKSPPAPPAPVHMHMHAAPAKRRSLPVILIGLAVVLILCCGGIAVISAADDDTPVTESSPATSPGAGGQVAAKPGASKAPAKPRVLLTAKGTGIKQTAKFKTAGDWTLKYTFDCTGSYGGKGNFAVMEYNNGDLSDVLVNELEKKGSDTIPVYTEGEHYLKVNTTCKWSLTATG